MHRLIPQKRSVVVAADVPNLQTFEELCTALRGVSGIGAVKLGAILAFKNLERAVNISRFILPTCPVIYDHQKAGTDIPDTAEGFAWALREVGIDAAILYPFAGPETQKAWTHACFGAGLEVLTGGIMTHQKFLASEGGYIADDAPERIYSLAAELGVRHFVVPGTKVEWVKKIARLLEEKLDAPFVLYAPGFITQGGDISECAKAAGDEWHPIVGSAIYEQQTAKKILEAALNAVSKINT